MTEPRTGKPIRLELIRNEPSCRKCRETEAVLAAVQQERPGQVSVGVLTATEAQLAGHDLVLTPTVLLDGKVLCAGRVPRREGLLRLVDRELAAASRP